jgi:hypothetical protein
MSSSARTSSSVFTKTLLIEQNFLNSFDIILLKVEKIS